MTLDPESVFNAAEKIGIFAIVVLLVVITIYQIHATNKARQNQADMRETMLATAETESDKVRTEAQRDLNKLALQWEGLLRASEAQYKKALESQVESERAARQAFETATAAEKRAAAAERRASEAEARAKAAETREKERDKLIEHLTKRVAELESAKLQNEQKPIS